MRVGTCIIMLPPLLRGRSLPASPGDTLRFPCDVKSTRREGKKGLD